MDTKIDSFWTSFGTILELILEPILEHILELILEPILEPNGGPGSRGQPPRRQFQVLLLPPALSLGKNPLCSSKEGDIFGEIATSTMEITLPNLKMAFSIMRCNIF